MQRDRISKGVRRLGATIGAVFLLLGVAELVTHLDQPLSLFFWLPTLWGGGALVLAGVLRPAARGRAALMIAGALLGLVATAWTVILPVLVLAFVVMVVVEARRRPPVPAAAATGA